ncbi:MULTISPECIES: MFS transporter [Legionella]|nr:MULTISPECIES: MFS transporter [Legionella]MCP0913721.1 MFS transporter [Legionella sp. 27cVA30]
MSESVAIDSQGIFPRTYWMPWLVCLSAGLFFLYEFFQLNLFDVINEPLRQEFHINAAELSWMSSAYLWADILFLLPAGIILDRFSTRFVILAAMFICVLSTVGFALTHSFVWASFFHFLSGIGNAFCFLSCAVLVSRWFPPRRQALVIGCLVTMAFIGGMMAHTPLAFLNEQYGWRNALFIDGGAGVLLFFWIFFTVKDRPDNQKKTSSVNQAASSGFSRALLNPQNWLAGCFTSFLNLPIMVLCALWGASYLETVHHLSKMAASNAVSLILVGSIIGCPVVGWLSDYMGRRKPLMILGAMATLLTVLPLFLHSSIPPVVLCTLFFLLGFFTSTQVISYPLIAESNPASSTGSATGISSVIIMGGGGLGQVLFGILMHHHAGAAQYSAADFQFAMWMFPVTIVAALVAVFFTRETYCKRYS